MTKINKFIISSFLLILVLAGCSEKENTLGERNNEEVPVLVNGIKKSVSVDFLHIISKKKQPTIKSAEPFNSEPDITIEHDGIVRKIFYSPKQGEVYYKEKDIVSHYEITKEEVDLLINETK